MNLIDFIENGATVANPNYKKGSKNPLTASPYLISNDPNDIISPSTAGAKSLIDKTYGLTGYNIKENKYDKYGVIVNPNSIEEELHLQRAKNQSGFEQLFNSLGQILENEIALGTIAGVGNIVDYVANWFKDEPNDYSSEFTRFFEELQEKNRERLAIYQENPDKAWQIGDFGWWANNFVSVGSTVSLMLPSMGVAKGLTWLGKATKLNKGLLNVAKAVANAGNRIDKGKKLLFRPHSFMANAGHWTEATVAAAASRIGEGYMEARETYNTIYEKALDDLSKMSTEDRADLIERNPAYANMSDVEIAKDLASISADNTFINDLPLFFIDLLQYKSLNNIFANKLKNGKPGAKARLEHRNNMNKLAGQAESEITNLALIKETLKYNFKNPKEILTSIPFHEGFEEGYQGIVQSKSQELYDMTMNPNIDARSLGSYLTDGHIWEQAFWGILGGVAFESVGKLGANIKDEIKRVKENKRLDKNNQKQKISNEKERSSEIASTFDKMKQLVEKMEKLNNGVHYSEFVLDKNGKPLIVDGQTQYKPLDEVQVFYEKQKLIDEFIDQMVMRSIDNNTYDLTKEFIESEYFDKYFKDAGMRESDVDLYIKNRVQSRLETTKDLYTKNLDILTTLIDNPYFHSLQLAAKELTRAELGIEAYNDTVNALDEKLRNLNELGRLTDGSYDKHLLDVIKINLDNLDKQEKDLRDDYKNKTISKAALDNALKELAKSRNKFYKMLSQVKTENESIKALKETADKLKAETDIDKANADYNSILNQITEIVFKENTEILTDSVSDILTDRAINDVKKQFDIMNLPVEENDYIEIYKGLDNAITEYTYRKYSKAFEAIENYVMNAENPDEAYSQLMEGNEKLSKELKDALEVLKLGARTNKVYYDGLQEVLKRAKAKQQKDAQEAQRVINNGQDLEGEEKDKTKSEVEGAIQSAQEQEDNPSTGEEVEDPVINDILNEAAEEQRKNEAVEAAMAKDADPYLQNGLRYNNYFDTYIVKHKDKKILVEIIKNINKAEYSDPNYKKIIDILVDSLYKDNGIDELTAVEIAKDLVANMLNQLAMSRETNPSFKQKYSILAKQIRTGNRIIIDGEMFSVTSIADDLNAKLELIDEIIKLYKIEHNLDENSEFDIDEFFNYMLANEELTYNDVAVIFNYFEDYIDSKEDFVIKQSSVWDIFKNNPEDFFNALRKHKSQTEQISGHMHIAARSIYRMNDVERQEYYRALEAAKNGAKVYIVQDEKNTSVLSIRCNGVEIGYITKTKSLNNTNTKYKKAIVTAGLNWIVEKTSSGYKSNYDELFKLLFTKDDETVQNFIDVLRNAVENKNVDLNALKSYVEEVLRNNLPVSADVTIMVDEIFRSTKTGSYALGNIKEILNVLEYRREDNPYFSYQGWLEKVYNNFVQTKQITDTITANQGSNLIVDFKHIGIPTPHYVKENVNIGNQPFVAERNPVVAVDKTGQMIAETGNHQFNSANIFNTGTMGLLLQNVNGNPIIARFAETNGVTKNTPLYNALKSYLIDIFTRYQTQESYTINNLYEDLLEILTLRKSKNDTEFNPLFTGYTLVKINGGIAIAKALPYGQKTGKTPFVLAIYDKKYTKKGYEGEAGNTRSYTLFNEEGKAYANMIDGMKMSFSVHNPLYILGMAEDLIAGLRFNRSMTFVKNRNEKNVKTNKHFYKENGKLYVEFGNTKLEYNSYFEFIMKNNAFKVNVGSVNGSFTYNSSPNKDLYISVNRLELGKSEYELMNPTANVAEAINMLKTADKDNAVSITNILNSLGFKFSDVYEKYLGSLFTDEIYYDREDTRNVKASTRNGKVYITKKGIQLVQTEPHEFIRLILHEQFHIALDTFNVFERKQIIKDLLDTYNQFVDAVEKLANNGQQDAIIIKHWIERNNFKPDNQFIADDVDNLKFVEEWLVESITNQPITKFLNTIEYQGTINRQEKKSILQKIIDVILKLLGIDFDNVNKSSILAKQLSLLNDEQLIDVKPNDEVTHDKPNNSAPVEGTQPNESEAVEEETEEDEEEWEEIEEDDEAEYLSATTSFAEISNENNYIERSLNTFADNTRVNPKGYKIVKDMEEFINSYPPQYRSKIRTLVATGSIEFICR